MGAPAGPEFEHDHFAPIVAQLEALALEVLADNFRSHTAEGKRLHHRFGERLERGGDGLVVDRHVAKFFLLDPADEGRDLLVDALECRRPADLLALELQVLDQCETSATAIVALLSLIEDGLQQAVHGGVTKGSGEQGDAPHLLVRGVIGEMLGGSPDQVAGEIEVRVSQHVERGHERLKRGRRLWGFFAQLQQLRAECLRGIVRGQRF